MNIAGKSGMLGVTAVRKSGRLVENTETTSAMVTTAGRPDANIVEKSGTLVANSAGNAGMLGRISETARFDDQIGGTIPIGTDAGFIAYTAVTIVKTGAYTADGKILKL